MSEATVERPFDQAPTAKEMLEVWGRVTRGHEIRTGDTTEGKRDVFVMDTAIRYLEVVAMFPAEFKKWTDNKINPPKFGRR